MTAPRPRPSLELPHRGPAPLHQLAEPCRCPNPLLDRQPDLGWTCVRCGRRHNPTTRPRPEAA